MISYEVIGHVGVIRMDDQSRRNALSVPLVEAVIQAIQDSRSEGVRALVIGSSASVFSAGADLAAMSKESATLSNAPTKSPFDLFETLAKDSRPIIAAVQAGAYGGGFELALCCDLIIAAEKAFFVLPELGHGVLPNTALSRLPALIGVQKARELAYTRRRLGAHEAHALGLVHSVVPEGDLIFKAVELAASIVDDAPPSGIAAAKVEFERWIGTDWSWSRGGRGRTNPEERKEGTTAFVEKRRPDYDRFWRAQ